jgi:hypothetical protein
MWAGLDEHALNISASVFGLPALSNGKSYRLVKLTPLSLACPGHGPAHVGKKAGGGRRSLMDGVEDSSTVAWCSGGAGRCDPTVRVSLHRGQRLSPTEISFQSWGGGGGGTLTANSEFRRSLRAVMGSTAGPVI